MSAPSDRIRAALARSGAVPPAVKRPPEPVPAKVEPALPAIAVNTENLEALLRSDGPRTLGLSTEIEDTLRLIAATDEERVAFSGTQTVSSQRRTQKRQRSSLTPILIPFGLILAMAGVAAFVYRDHWLPSPSFGAPAAENNSPLQVKAEPQSNGLIDVRWNPRSAPIAEATGGRLVIQEHDQQPRIVELNLEQLSIGHVSYKSSTESLELRLEVMDGSRVIAQESVLALAPRGSAPPRAEQPSPPGRVAAPPVSTGTEDSAVSEPLAAPGQNQSQPVRIGSNLQEAKLIQSVTPVYPAAAKVGGIQGTVRFEAIISKTGAVRTVQVLGGPPSLIQAATDAVKQWIYSPTLLNGEPVEVVTQIEVIFSSD